MVTPRTPNMFPEDELMTRVGIRSVRRLALPAAVLLLAILALAAAYLHFVRGYAWAAWTGLNKVTIWDLLQILSVPTMISLATLFINRGQHERDFDRQREAALQAYLDKMTDLLLGHKLGEADGGESVRVVARSRTLTVLGALDGTRKGSVVTFLQESGLIDQKNTIVNLYAANLDGARLRYARLNGANLGGVDMKGADLRNAHLRGANLSSARLQGSNLRNASLRNAYLITTHLEGVDLTGAHLDNANLDSVEYDASTIWPQGFTPPPKPVPLDTALREMSELRAANESGPRPGSLATQVAASDEIAGVPTGSSASPQ